MVISSPAVRSSPPPVILSPEGAKNPIAPEALALSSPFFPAPANPATHTKGTSHHRGGRRAPASGSTDAQHMARDRAPPRLAVGEDGEWRDRRPRLLSPQRPRRFHYQARVSEYGAHGRHPRESGCHPRASGCHPRPGSRSGASSSGDPAVVRLVRGAPCALCSLSPWERAG